MMYMLIKFRLFVEYYSVRSGPKEKTKGGQKR